MKTVTAPRPKQSEDRRDDHHRQESQIRSAIWPTRRLPAATCAEPGSSRVIPRKCQAAAGLIPVAAPPGAHRGGQEAWWVDGWRVRTSGAVLVDT